MSSSRRVSLCSKVLGSFAVSLALTVLTGAIALTAIHGLGRRWEPLYHRYLDLAQSHQFPEAHQIMADTIPLVDGLEKAADALIAEQRKISLPPVFGLSPKLLMRGSVRGTR
jgi:hypothetical protein